jgi:hypothetical protein
MFLLKKIKNPLTLGRGEGQDSAVEEIKSKINNTFCF